MIVYRRPRQFVLLVRVLPLLAGCVPTLGRPVQTPAPLLARRLVLALDGIDYRTMVAAQARGLFATFRPPSRLISTFPSISDIAWHEIFGLQPPSGYQRVYFSAAHNEKSGGPLDAIRPIEYEERMDIAFGTKFHHLGAYLISSTMARREVNSVIREFYTIRGRSTVYAYNVGPDALQHTKGDIARYLQHLDTQLTALAGEYLRRTGRPLEIVILSDHGHNGAVDAKFLPVAKLLEARGFHPADRLLRATDVSFSVDGVTTGFGVYVLPDSQAVVAATLAALEGVELVSRRLNDSVFTVQSHTQLARIERRSASTEDRYRYVPVDGDPLHYASLLDSLSGRCNVDREGFADAATWIRCTADAEYPAAVVRIARGHTSVTRNPAPILVSLEDRFRVGLGMMSLADRLLPLGSSHGGLSATNSLGVLMTNFVETHDDYTVSVNQQLNGFYDLGPVRYTESGARLTDASLLSRYSRDPFYTVLESFPRHLGTLALEFWITDVQRAWANGRGLVLVEVRRRGGDSRRSPLVGMSYRPLPEPGAPNGDGTGWIAAPDRRHYMLPLSQILIGAIEPNAEYEVRVVLDRLTTGATDARMSSRSLASITARSDAKGELRPF